MMKRQRSNAGQSIDRRLGGYRPSRNGAFVLIPLLCLILALAVIGEILRQSSLEIKQLKKHQIQLQATWLADAAAQRAVQKLNQQPKYTGEVWKLLPEEIDGNRSGEVVIKIKIGKQKKSSILIRTEASYPARDPDRVRIIREWPFELRDQGLNN